MPEPRTTRSHLLGAFAAGAIVVGFCLLLLWHDPLLFWNDDYELSVLPVFADVARSWSEGHWPLLSPYSWVCGNLAGEFQYGTFSLFVNAAVVLIWKFPFTFAQQAAAVSITHLVVLAVGAFVLARGRDFSIALSIFVALVAALNGWIVCWGATDWFGALAAFAWLPWAWWACEKSVEAAVGSRGSAHVPPGTAATTVARRAELAAAALWPTPFVYLVITGGFPYTILMVALVVAWLCIKSLGQTRSVISVLPMLGGLVLGIGLAAPAWLALFDYVSDSARAAQTSTAHWQWLLPLTALPGFVLPSWTVNWADFSTRYLPHSATELACGLVAPSTLLAGFVSRPRLLVRQLKWELLLLVIVLVLAMFPTAGLFRWSFRWLPLFHLLLALCAAEVLRLRPVPPTASASVLLLIFVTIAMSVFNTKGDYGVGVMFVYFSLALTWAVGEWFLPDIKFREWAPVAVTFSILLATYVWIPPNSGVPKYNFAQQLLAPAPLDPQRLYLSIYPPTEHTYRVEKKPKPVGQVVRPGSTSMWAGLRFVNGYSPILAAGVARQFSFAIHGEIDPGMGDYLLTDQSGLLQQLGVDGLVVAREIATNPASAVWQLVFSNDEGRVFHRAGLPLPHVRSVNWIDSHPGEKFARAAILRINDSRNRVDVEVDVPIGGNAALLEFSRPYFRGYTARMGNSDLLVESHRGLIPMVKVPPGSHGRLILAYRPRWLIYGSAISTLSAAIFCAGIVAAAVTRGRIKGTAA
jgi:hypothetical protein